MKRGCFIIPYFGLFPNMFPLFLATAEKNDDYDWFIFTNNKYTHSVPQNVRFFYMSFSDMQQLIQSKFPFEIVLNTPYKLCDYKCAYGYIFEEFLTEYDHWGYCDIDLLFGNISHFIDSDMLDYYDKIGHLGHFSLYKNKKEINELFMSDNYYLDVFTNDRIYVFDEWNNISINTIMLKKNHSICYLNSWTDIYPHNSYLNQVNCVFGDDQSVLYRTENKIHFFEWNDGTLYDHVLSFATLKPKEVMYVHLQKRKMTLSDKINTKPAIHIFCIPDKLVDISEWKPCEFIILSFVRRVIDTKKFRFQYKSFIYKLKERLYLFLKG